jgi:hypothetical protein
MKLDLKSLDLKSFVAGVLCVSAFLLVMMHLNLNTVAKASEAISGRDYQLVTARITKGGDALYILNKRTGLIGIFTWDPAARGVTVKDVRSMDQMMGAK